MKAFVMTATGCLLALGGALTIGWASTAAQAQSACIMQCRDNGWSYSQCNRYCETRFGEPNYARGSGPRVYGYTSLGRSGCGQYHYMKAGRCVDARINPPNLQ